MAAFSFLDRDNTVAGPGFNRWLVPPAALAIHLSIGQVYAFSVFKNPLLALTGADGSHWDLKSVGYIFSIAIGVLGLAAALFGKWLEKAGPRKAMFVAACCFGAGFLIASEGAALHQLWLVYLGYGVVGGIGLGMGYISPVATLIKWFPDRPGLATGMAIMGFGGGAMIGSPLATKLMLYYKPNGHAIASTWITMGIFYFVLMMFGVFTVRIPAHGWKPEGWTPPQKAVGMISTHNVSVNSAMKTPQFWQLWLVLALNTTAGIGILEQASPMIQDLFHGKVLALAAGGFVGVLSLFNMAGRFIWSSLSDYIGRKTTFLIFFIIGPLFYWLLPLTGIAHLNSIPLFVIGAGVLISIYGGGFSTIPAYLRDLYGPLDVSAIYGRLLTAWSVAGIVGPLIVNGILDHYVALGQPKVNAYPVILHIMTGLLVVGFISNLLVRPIDEKYWMAETPGRPVPVGAAH
jgi:MFS family permease